VTQKQEQKGSALENGKSDIGYPEVYTETGYFPMSFQATFTKTPTRLHHPIKIHKTLLLPVYTIINHKINMLKK
jgi:hypothetical protein